jgi:1-acyl-sn-glycerol-3-phosphate acyltransferase
VTSAPTVPVPTPSTALASSTAFDLRQPLVRLTPWQRTKNYLGWLFILVTCLFLSAPHIAVIAVASLFGKNRAVGDFTTRWWLGTLVWLWGVQFELHGAENLPRGPAVFICNHRSHLDPPTCITALQNHVRVSFMLKRELTQIPIWGWFVRLAGFIPVDRDNKAGRDQLKEPLEALASGRPVLIFPEGSRSTTHQFLNFKRGAVVLASKAGVPIVPLVVSGSGPLWPKNSLFIRQGRVRLDVLPPVQVPNDVKDKAHAINDALRRQLAAHYRLSVDAPPAAEVPGLVEALLQRRPEGDGRASGGTLPAPDPAPDAATERHETAPAATET